MVTWDQPKFITDSIISFSLIYALDHEANILKKMLNKETATTGDLLCEDVFL